MYRLLRVILTFLALVCGGANAHAQIYVAYRHAGIISKYDTDTGALISEHFLLGLKEPRAVALVDGTLYVLQEDGTIGRFDGQTGAAINERLVSGLNMPQAMAVSGGTLYVSSFGWPSPEGGMAANLIGTYNADTGAAINPSFVKTDTLASSLAVSGQKLFVAGGSQTGRTSAYSTVTGAPVELPAFFAHFLNEAGGVVVADNWLWFTAGAGSSEGVVFKFNADTGDSAVGPGLFHPLIMKLDQPSMIAISGDELFIGGPGTSVSTYNAITGDLIKAAIIPDLSDQFGGIAVVPRASTQQDSWDVTKFETKNNLLNFAFWSSMHGDYLYLASGLLVVLAAFGLFALMFFRGAAKQPEPDLVGTTPQSIAVESADVEVSPPPTEPEKEEADSPITGTEEPAPEPTTSAVSRSPSPLTMVATVLLAITLFLAGGIAWFASQALPSPNFVPHQDTSDLIGIWGYENSTREPEQMPILLSLSISTTHLDFSSGHGTQGKDGRWHDDGFWCQAPDGSGEVEVAKIISPEEIEFHPSVFDSRDQTVDTLYKERGSDAEMAAIAAKYPSPITYPPPAGIIKYWMSEYDLKCLPWKADRLEVVGESYSRGLVYVYHSDDPHVGELQVTVKNHRVCEIKGGNN